MEHVLAGFESIDALESALSLPTPEVIQALAGLDGDITILGAGGKMGPTLTLLARRAVVEGGLDKRVIAVSRFSEPGLEAHLQQAGVETISCDLMADGALDALPDAGNVIYMVGFKFGGTGQEALMWAVNTFLPGRVAQRWRGARFVVFSSGNLYGLTPVLGGGCSEAAPPAPAGEYATSVLGRERVFTHFAHAAGTPAVLFRLNYAVELRYGVLLDVARQVWAGVPVDVSMGYVNVIWQGDANRYALRALALAQNPPLALNITGPEIVSVRALALQFGKLFGRTPLFESVEQPDALLSDAGQAFALLGYPSVPLGRMIEWVASWVARGGVIHSKPTHFQVRDGRF